MRTTCHHIPLINVSRRSQKMKRQHLHPAQRRNAQRKTEENVWRNHSDEARKTRREEKKSCGYQTGSGQIHTHTHTDFTKLLFTSKRNMLSAHTFYKYEESTQARSWCWINPQQLGTSSILFHSELLALLHLHSST